MATRLERSYLLPKEKTISGIAANIENYFVKFEGMDVCVDELNSTCFLITCRTKAVHKSIKGNTKRLTGHDLNISVGLFEQENNVIVRFDQEINEGTRAATAIIVSFAGIGFAKLHGIKKRHDIPFELNDVITAYLKG